MTTVQLPMMPNHHGNKRNRKGKLPSNSGVLSGDIRYTSLKARKACTELGISPIRLPKIRSHDRRQNKRETELSTGTFATTYCRALRHKSKQRKPLPAATIVIGRLKSDYVTKTSQWPYVLMTAPPKKIPPLIAQSFSGEMGKQDLKGILQMSKPAENRKRVTFNKDVKVEEFKPNSAIIDVSKDDSTPKSEVDKEKPKDNTDATANGTEPFEDTQQNLSDRPENDSPNESNHHETIDNSEQPQTIDQQCALQGPVSGDDLIPFKRQIAGENSVESDTEVEIDSTSTSLATHTAVKPSEGQQQSSETQQSPSNLEQDKYISDNERNCKGNMEELSSTVTGEEVEVSSETTQNNTQDMGEETEEFWNGEVYTRKRLKKMLSANAGNLPAIREELHSISSNATVGENEFRKSNGNRRQKVSEHSDDSFSDPDEILTKDDVIKKVRDDARLSALKGQIAADKAAWSCALHYPRQAASGSASGRSSPLTPDVIRNAAKRSPGRISPLNERAAFPLSDSPPLALYRPNVGPKFSSNFRTLPPLQNPRFKESGLVTQRNSKMWMPDVSFVGRNSRHRVKVKGSQISVYEVRK